MRTPVFRNLVRLAAAALGGLLVLPAFAQAPTEIVVWHAYRGNEKTAFEKVVANYNQAMAGKGVKVTTLAVPFDAFNDKITAAVPRGKGPDVFIAGQDRLGGWVEAGNTIEPIDFYLEKTDRTRFIPSTMEAMTYQKTTYGLPMNFKVIAMIYNKKLLPNPPKTTGELVATAKKLTDAGAGRFGLAYWYSNFYYHAALMNGFGGKVFDAQRNPVLNNPENVKSLDYLMKWFTVDGILPAEPGQALITSLFNEGKTAMIFDGPWVLGEIAKGVDYAVTTLPTIDEAQGKPMRPWITVEGAFVAAPSKNKEKAFEFVKYITDTPAGLVMALEGRQTPANLAVYDDAKVKADPVLSAFRKQVDAAVPMPNLPEMSMFWGHATTAMNILTKKSATPKAAMDEAQAKLAKDVAGLRKK